MSKTGEKPMIGGKAKGLEFLQENGFLVPLFFALPHDILCEKRSLVEKLSSITKDQSSTTRWAVRSSASIEDGAKKSYAGQFKTLLNLKTEDLTEAIYTVIDSYSSIGDNKYGVILQEMIEPEISGVIFSRDPVDMLSDDIVLSVVPGIGSKLVSGELPGCSIRIRNGVIFSIEEGEFEGFKFSATGETLIQFQHQKILQLITPLIGQISDGVKRLEKLKKYPIDIEFALNENKFYWLQQRPITSRNFLTASAVWDKTAAEISFPGLTLPLSCSLNNRTIGSAFQKVDAAVGYSKKILKQNEAFSSQMSGEIKGALYYNVTSWQSLIYQLPFGKKYAKQLTTTWGMNEMPFQIPAKRHNCMQRVRIGITISFMLLRSKKYQNNYKASFQKMLDLVDNTDMNKMSSSQLLDLYLKIEDELTRHYFAPVSNGYFAMVSFSRLKEQLSKTRILETYPNFANDVLMNQKDLISVAAVNGLHDLLDEIVADPELFKLILSQNAPEIVTSLSSNFLPFLFNVKAYISAHGHRAPTGDLKVENTPFSDDINLFIDYLKANSTHYKKRIKQAHSFDYRTILKQELKSRPMRKRKIEKLIVNAIHRTRDREMYRYQRSQAFSISRRIFLQMGCALNKEGLLKSEKDIMHLTFQQIADPLTRSQYTELINVSKVNYERYSKLELPSTFAEAKGEFHPVFQQAGTIQDGEIRGVGCCSGIVSGPFLVVDVGTDLKQDFSDYILIGLYFEPGQMNLISNAKGIISERGNLLSHTAIICREMGIPSIVGARGITAIAENKSLIKMDGGTGVIRFEDHEQL